MARKVTSSGKREFFGRKFSKLLDEWKKANGKTQDAFCREFGFGETSVIEWKQGKRFPNAVTLEKLCEVLGMKRCDFDRDYEMLAYLDGCLAGALKAVRQIRQRFEAGEWGK